METLLSTFTESIGDQQDENFSQDDNIVPKKKMKRKKDYSNKKVKTRNLLTNVSYRRFKQSDFNKNSFIIDILLFLVQNFNPINLERKLDIEKERDMIKFLWDECILHDFIRYLYKQVNYIEISKSNLTYQKANNIVKNFISEDLNQIYTLKYKIDERFPLIHYIYSTLFSKIYNRMTNFGIQNKNNFDFYFQSWKNRKSAGAIAPKILKQLPLPQANQITTEVLSTAKDPSNYQNREAQKNEQILIDIKMSDNDELVTPTIANVTIDNFVKNKKDENVFKQRAAKGKMLEKQLSENTVRMNKIKKSKKL